MTAPKAEPQSNPEVNEWVIVLGDHRIHQITSGDGECGQAISKETYLWGGATLMEMAVNSVRQSAEAALTYEKPVLAELSSHSGTTEHCVPASAGPLEDDNPEWDGFETGWPVSALWEAINSPVPELSPRVEDGGHQRPTHRIRLKRATHPAKSRLARRHLTESPSFLRAPCKAAIHKLRKAHSALTSDTGNRWPTLVVVDDLGMNPGETVDDHQFFRSIEIDLLDDAKLGGHEMGDWDPESGIALSPSALRQAYLSTVAHLLSEAVEVTAKRTRPAMEPAIVYSIAGRTPPEIVPIEEVGKYKNFFNFLYYNEKLRRRTALVLDVDDIRNFTNCSVAIRSGTTWERIVEDTLNAFRQTPELVNLLNFGHVIVRYGVAGVLVVRRNYFGDCTSTFFFDPHRSDTDWIAGGQDGSVLGMSSVVVQQILAGLSRMRSYREKQAHLSDFRAGVDQGVREAIRKCQMLYRFSNGLHFDAMNQKPKIGAFDFKNDENRYPCAHLGQFAIIQHEENRLCDLELRRFGEINVKGTIATNIQQAQLPPVIFSGWSFLQQATRHNLLAVAEGIVEKGVEQTLNTRMPALDDLSRDIATHLMNAVKKQLAEDLKSDTDPTTKHADYAKRLGESLAKETFHRDLDLDADDLQKEAADYWAEMSPALHAWITKPIRDDRRDLQVAKCIEETVEALLAVRNDTEAQITKAVEMRLKATQIMLNDVLNDPFETPMSRSSASSAVPIFRFGRLEPKTYEQKKDERLLILDRSEAESLLSIRSVLKKFLKSDPSSRPLSIGVFGPPGSGKSFAVKQIVKGFEQSYRSFINLSEFTSADEVSKKLLEGNSDTDELYDFVAASDSKSKRGKIANLKDRKGCRFIFVDEFDSALGEQSFGWLKYFLSPMEDGIIGGKHLLRTVFIFAGGTSSSFAEFSRERRPKDSLDVINFVRAKGTDFTSRLAAHVDIIGPDPRTPDDDLYIIRRAVLVRAILEKVQGKGPFATVNVDPPLLRAILRAPFYKHGVRSIRMIIDACKNRDDHVVLSSVPTVSQLDMIVDSKSFLREIRDYNQERQP